MDLAKIFEQVVNTPIVWIILGIIIGMLIFGFLSIDPKVETQPKPESDWEDDDDEEWVVPVKIKH